MTVTEFDILRATATDLQHLLSTKALTSVHLVEKCLQQIDRHNHAGLHLNALLSVAPRHILLSTAITLDEERLSNKLRSPLHGIPIVLKDSIMTHPDLGMATTVGSWAFVGAKPKKNAALVDKLIDAGLIILGKANLTEFCGVKNVPMTPGWSAFGGQAISPYVGPIEENELILGHSSPGGSSVGSGVAVAAGFAPLSIGTETIGSIVTPGTRAGLYALKPTVGDVDMAGIFTLSKTFDSAGPMAKSARDLLPLLEIMTRPSRPFGYREDWDGFSIGFADPEIWKMAEGHCRQHPGTAEQMKHEYEAAISAIGGKGATVKYPVAIPEPPTFTVGDEKNPVGVIAFWEFKNVGVPEFVKGLSESRVHSLEEIVEFHERHRELALPEPRSNQDDLVKALKNEDSEENIIRLRREFKKVAREALDKIFQEHNLDVIAAPADSALCHPAAAAGYPVAIVPLGALKYNGRPFGICLMAKAHEEHKLLHFMTAFETLFPNRPIPSLLRENTQD